jgi:hypothetical protein
LPSGGHSTREQVVAFSIMRALQSAGNSRSNQFCDIVLAVINSKLNEGAKKCANFVGDYTDFFSLEF